MAVLHLIHGLPGSGKTTFAKKLARKLPAVRLTPDDWMTGEHGPNPPEAVFRAEHAKIMVRIWQHAAFTLQAGADAILDIGFFDRKSRDEARQWAGQLGVTTRLYLLPCTPDEARRRVLARTAAGLPGTLVIDTHTFDFLLAQFEPLGPDEPHVVVAEGTLVPTQR